MEFSAVQTEFTASGRSKISLAGKKLCGCGCGRRLAGLRVKLVVRREKTTYVDGAGVKKSTTIHALNLELTGGRYAKTPRADRPAFSRRSWARARERKRLIDGQFSVGVFGHSMAGAVV